MATAPGTERTDAEAAAASESDFAKVRPCGLRSSVYE